MKVLVTGGTGFVGREVVKELRQQALTPRLVVRNLMSRHVDDLSFRFAPEIFTANILDLPPLQLAMHGCDAVIHLVGIITEAGEQTYENMHVRATENVLRAAQAEGVRRIIHMSALGTRPDAKARYHQTKWAAEEAVRSSGLDWTIFRPSIIYGPGDGFVNLFARISRFSPIVPLIGGGHSKFQPIAVDNVARSFVAALNNKPASIGQTLNLCGNEVLTLREIIDSILTATNRRRVKLPLPFAVARVQAALMEFLFAKIFRKAPPLNRDQLVMLREDNVGDGRAANELFSLKHEPFLEGISRYL